MTKASDWTDEKDEMLRQLWGNPALSIADIADLLDCSHPAARHRSAKLKLGRKYTELSEWTTERRETLALLWSDASITAAIIAERLGVSRNAIIGQAHRLNLPPKAPAPSLGPRKRRPKADSFWTPEREARLVELFKDGYSGSEIARTLGEITRNACIAKLSRLGFTAGRPQAAYNARRNAPRGGVRRNPKTIATAKPKLSIAGNGAVFEQAPEVLSPVSAHAWEPLPNAAPIPLEALTGTTCRWPVELAGDLDTTHFCGAFSAGTYCHHHAKRAYAPAKVKVRLDVRLGLPVVRRRAA